MAPVSISDGTTAHPPKSLASELNRRSFHLVESNGGQHLQVAGHHRSRLSGDDNKLPLIKKDGVFGKS
jgi:hypothetical protein